MMRALRTPQASNEAGTAVVVRRFAALGLRVLLSALLIATVIAADSAPAHAQKSAFPETPGGVFGTTPKIDTALPLHLHADELVYDNAGSKVIARGNVEIQYQNNNLTADEVVYDQSANTLSAAGNVVLREANGNIIRAERYNVTDDFRDGFVDSLRAETVDKTRFTASRAERVGGTSIRYGLAVFREQEIEASAEGHFVHVYVDRATLTRPTPLPDALRRAAEAILVPPAH